MSDSPLSSASPTSLEELFSKDPWDLSDSDRMAIIVALRSERARWEFGEKAKKMGKKATTDLNLDDLLKDI